MDQHDQSAGQAVAKVLAALPLSEQEACEIVAELMTVVIGTPVRELSVNNVEGYCILT